MTFKMRAAIVAVIALWALGCATVTYALARLVMS